MGKKKSGKGSSQEELQVLQRELSKARAKGDMKEVSNIHNRIGIIYRELGQYQEALQEHQDEASVTRKYFPEDKLGLGVALRANGEVYIEMKEEEKALPLIKEYLRLSMAVCDLVEEQRAHVTLGRVYLGLALRYSDEEGREKEKQLYLGKAEKQFIIAKQLTEHAKVRASQGESEVVEMRCGVFLNLYLVMDTGGRTDESLAFLLKAVEMAEKHSLHESLYRGKLALYDAHARKRNWKEVLISAEGALKAAKALSNPNLLGEAEFMVAKTYFLLGDVEKGISLLKRLRKKGNFSSEDLDPTLQAAIRIRRIDEKLLTLGTNAGRERIRLEEILGDKFVFLGNYEEGIKHYKEALKIAQEVNVGREKKAALLFSLAETFLDLGHYEEGRKYFLEELNLQKENPSEAFKTQTRLCVLLEKGGFLDIDVEEAHQKAIQIAKDATNPAKEVTAFTNYAHFLKKKGNLQQAEKAFANAEEAKRNISDNEADSEEFLLDDANGSVSGSSIDLQDLSSDGEDSEDAEEKAQKTISSSKRKFRLNEKGETPLHVAAKKGDLKSVRRLLRQGHEVNPRDSAGWIPLHEAANYGNIEVVEELLNNGARINDQPGGRDCDRITPLHDAASNGHLDVVNLFLRRGANVLVKDAHGNIPMDTLIMAYEGVSDAASDEGKERWNRTFSFLRDKMQSKGFTYTRAEEEKARKNGRKLLLSGGDSPQTEFGILRAKHGGEKIPIRVSVDDFDPDDGDAAVNFYSKTIRGLRGKKKRDTLEEEEDDELPRSEVVALIPETSYVDDDWLEEDVGRNGRKRRRKDDFPVTESRKPRKEKRNDVALLDVGQPSRNSSPSVGSLDSDIERDDQTEIRHRSPSPLSISEILTDTVDVSSDSDSEKVTKRLKVHKSKSVAKQTKLQFSRIIKPNEQKSPAEMPSLYPPPPREEDVLRLRISISGKVFGVPLLHHQSEENIQWLCQEAGKRYSESEGLFPILRLRTKEGALLSANDIIRVAVGGSNSELEGEILSFDLPRLPDRFKEALAKTTSEYPCCEIEAEILKALEVTHSSDVLTIINRRLCAGSPRTSLFSALQCQFGLREINLCGCSLFDDGVRALSAILHTLPSLQMLNLSLNGLSAESLSHLTNSIRNMKQKTNQTPIPGLGGTSRGLITLDLSFNPFGDSCGSLLTQLLSQLDHLRKLYLADTDISAQTFRESTLLSLLARLKLEELDLRYNGIGENETNLLCQSGAFDLIQKFNSKNYDPR